MGHCHGDHFDSLGPGSHPQGDRAKPHLHCRSLPLFRLLRSVCARYSRPQGVFRRTDGHNAFSHHRRNFRVAHRGCRDLCVYFHPFRILSGKNRRGQLLYRYGLFHYRTVFRGPAKTAVVASGFMGSVAGSAVANVVATGSFTIPMMKKIGYRPHVAAAVEAAASTGDSLCRPSWGPAPFSWRSSPRRPIWKS